MQSLTIDLDGPFHYADYGGDGPPMVLLHGIGGSHINWMSVAPALAQRFHVYAIDMIGFGFTPIGHRNARFPTQARFVDRFIREVSGGPAVVMGHSMGGVIGMMLAATYPSAVTRLVPIDPAACPISGGERGVPTWLMLALARLPALGGGIAGVIARRAGPEKLIREGLGRAYAPGSQVDPAFFAAHVDLETLRAGLPAPYRGYIEGYASMHDTHAERRAFLTDVVGRIAAPTLLVRGTVDPRIPQRWFERLSQARPDWDNARLEGLGHDPHMEAPGAFLEAVGGWLENSQATLSAATPAPATPAPAASTGG
jgi:pimeloyl-ACP methyl ester carboxylesterase